MRPISLKLKGAIGIRDGLGIEQVELDFTPFAPGLICIVGPNGSGKSTLMENLHPFLCLASRDGTLTDHFYLSDSFRDFTFQVGSSLYRSMILVDAVAGRSEAYLYRDGAALNDGKISTYKESVESVLGSPTLFFKSIFAGQGAIGITHLPVAKRKDLFMELLGLERFDRYREYALAKTSDQERALSVQRAIVERTERDLEQRPAYLKQLSAFELQLVEAETRMRSKSEEAEAIDRELLALRDRLALRRQQEREKENMKEAINGLEVLRDSARADFESGQKRFEKERARLAVELDRLAKVLEDREQIGSKVSELHTLRRELSRQDLLERDTMRIEQEEQQARLAHQQSCQEIDQEQAVLLRERDRRVAEETLLRQKLEGELRSCERDLSRAKTRASLVKSVPCSAVEGLPEKCTLLAQAMAARAQLGELENRVRLLQSKQYLDENGLLKIEQAMAEVDKKLVRLKVLKPAFNEEPFRRKKLDCGYEPSVHENLRACVAKLEEQEWERKADELTKAESKESERRMMLDAIDRQISEARSKHAQGEVQYRAQIDDKLSTMDAIVLEKDLPDENIILRRRRKVEGELDALRALQLRVTGECAVVRAALERLETLTKEASGARGQVQRLTQQVSHWKLLQLACSKDGIPALELDAAGPAVSHIANELLAASFGQQFQLRFETTRASKDNKKKLETFDVRIGGEHGQKLIDDLSGGERVWVERAISESIAIYLSEVSGKEYLTSFQDESDGPLDPENKQNFLAMLQASFKLGRRYYTFLITQTPELWQQVDQRIELDPKRSIITQVY